MRLKSPQEQERYITTADKGFPICLLYGPDSGLAHERARKITEAILGKKPDPMAISVLDEKEILERDTSLADELSSPMLLADKRVIRLTLNADKMAEEISQCLSNPSRDCFLILLGGDLGTKSKIRQMFEKHKEAPAIPCYQDDPGVIQNIVQNFFRERNIKVDAELAPLLAANLGNDRGVTLMELEKLVTYLGDEKTLTLETAQQVLDYNGSHSYEMLAIAVLQNNYAQIQSTYRLLVREGEMPVTLIRVMANFITRLWQIKAQQDQGKSFDEAAKGLYPPIHFKTMPTIRQFCQRYSLTLLGQMLARLNDMEAQIKRYYAIQEDLCLQSLLTFSAGIKSQSR